MQHTASAKMGSIDMSPPTKKPWIETPLIESSILSKAAGCRIFLKLENLQPASSFKSRGIGNYILSHIAKQGRRDTSTPSKPLHFYSSSGGNAGMACVVTAISLGYPASVVVPLSTPAMTIASLLAAGASDVVQEGASWANADKHLREVVMEKARERGEEAVYVPPFDAPEIWEGNAGLVEELQRQLHNMGEVGRPDAIVCSVGGGGLFCGVVEGVDRVGWSDSRGGESSSKAVQVLAMETHGADSLSQSLAAGELVTLPAITSVATGLGAVRVAAQTFKQGQRAHVTSVVLSDAQACMGAWRFADDERILVEPACGVSLALCYLRGRLRRLVPGLAADSRVVVVVCGGSRITIDMMAQYRERFGREAEADETANAQVPSSHS